jgi:hypothetical protein
MVKFPVKYVQIDFNNSLKISHDKVTLLSSQGFKNSSTYPNQYI